MIFPNLFEKLWPDFDWFLSVPPKDHPTNQTAQRPPSRDIELVLT